jgi:hypothetical protein
MYLTLWKGPGHPVIPISRQAPETMISGERTGLILTALLPLKRATNLSQILW